MRSDCLPRHLSPRHKGRARLLLPWSTSPGPDGQLVPPEPLDAAVEDPQGAAGDAEVTLELTVDAQGAVRDVTVLVGEPAFAEAASGASVARWRFKPATLRGKPVPARIRYVVQFKKYRGRGRGPAAERRSVVAAASSVAAGRAPSARSGSPD